MSTVVAAKLEDFDIALPENSVTGSLFHVFGVDGRGFTTVKGSDALLESLDERIHGQWSRA